MNKRRYGMFYKDWIDLPLGCRAAARTLLRNSHFIT